MFLSKNKKNNVHPCKPQFYYIKVGFKGVKIIYPNIKYYQQILNWMNPGRNKHTHKTKTSWSVVFWARLAGFGQFGLIILILSSIQFNFECVLCFITLSLANILVLSSIHSKSVIISLKDSRRFSINNSTCKILYLWYPSGHNLFHTKDSEVNLFIWIVQF